MTSIRTENSLQAFTLAEVDVDGAIQETMAAAAGDTRAGFLAKAGLFGGGLIGGGALLAMAPAVASAATKNDVAILNFALTLEHLEAEFYTEAEKMGALSGEAALFARVVGDHERAHVKGLKAALGRAAVKKPKFNFRGTTEDMKMFMATAQVLEDTGVAAYKGQAPMIDSDAVLNAALAIHSVEARHAAWIRDMMGMSPAPNAFDPAMTKGQVLRAVASTRFIVAARNNTGGSTRPSFTG
ncbi:MAG: ferritin-like domain-containing protein [Actinomycetota bacterium]|nr:ferritin-like domain-containing protein [Actinomycetota bacterium]